MARIASASGRPVSWGTCTSSLPETTSTLTVDPLSTSLPAGGSWLTIVPSALSLRFTYVGSSSIPSCWAVAVALSRDWSTNEGSVTVPGPGVADGPSAVKMRKRPKPTSTRMARPSRPATQIQGLVPRGSSGSSSSGPEGAASWAERSRRGLRRRRRADTAGRRWRARRRPRHPRRAGTVRGAAPSRKPSSASAIASRAGEAGGRVRVERPAVDCLQDRRDVRSDGRDERRRGRDAGHRHGRRAVALPGAPAREELVQHDAQAVDVGRLGRLLAERLLRAEVVDRAERHAGQRQAGVGPGAGDPEVGDLDAAVGRDEHVARLHVAVDDPAGVRGGEGVGDLRGQARRLAGRERAVAGEERRDVLAVHELHDDVRAVGVGAEVVDADDVRVAQGRGGLGLLPEPRDEGRIAAVLGVEDLDRDLAAQLGVGGTVDRRHAALAQELDEPIPAAEHVAERCHSSVSPCPRSSARTDQSSRPRR